MNETELRFHALFNLRLDLAGLLSPAGVLTAANDRSLSFAGVRREDVIGRPFWETPWWSHDPALQARLRASVKRAAAGEASRFEARHRDASGELRLIDFSLTPVPRADGSIAFLLAEGVDITDRRRSQQRIAESEARFEGIVASAMDAIVAVDEELHVVLFNQAAERMFGYAREEVLGGRLDRFLPERFRADHAAQIRRFAATGVTSRRMGALGNVRGLRADGKEFPIEAAISQTVANGTLWLTVILRDMSERDAAAERLQRSEERTRAAENLASVGTLAAGLAHEIGTPMGVVRGHAELLQGKVADDKSRWRVNTIIEQIDRISNIIRALLNLSRPRRPERVPVALDEVVDTALSFLEDRLRKRSITVERDFAAVPTLRGDPEKLQQLFLNLFLNAADAMREGGTLRLRIDQPEAGRLRAVVADTGEGIASADLPRVFDPFFTSKQAGQGSGLGLVVARSIAVDHGGKIEVRSAPGEGATFTIELPVVGEGTDP